MTAGWMQSTKSSKRLKWWTLLALLVVMMSGCGAADTAGSKTAAVAEMKADSAAQSTSSSAAMPAAEKNAVSAGASVKNEALKQADSFNGSGPAADASASADRKIIYKASLNMQVEKYGEAQMAIEGAVKQAGGYVLQFSENETPYEKSGRFVIKVPASGFSSLLSQLEKIHPSTQKNMQGQDVSEEYVDLTARLKAKQVVESRLIAFMEKATKTDELLAFSNELGKTQEEIERIKGRMRYLEQNVSYSTIELRVSQKLGSAAVIQAQDRGPLIQRAAAALNGSAAVLTMVFQWIVVVLAAVLPVVLVLAVITLPFWWIRRNRSKKLIEIRKKLSEENGETKRLESEIETSDQTDK